MAWQAEYKRKLTTADAAVRAVESNMRVYVHANAAFPGVLLEALTRRSGQLRNVEMMHLLGFGEAYYNRPEFAESFRHNALFISSNMRQSVEDGRADYIPVHLSEIEDLFRDKRVELDVALLHVSTPDRHGYCSLGVAVETTLTAARCARIRIAQVNDQMPRTFGNTFMHVKEFDAIVECSRPLPELIQGAVTEDDWASRCGADQRRSMCAGRHRLNSQRNSALSERAQGSWHPHRDADGKCNSVDRKGRDYRGQEAD
jgi:acetyl-CoA hydrolase